jgi:hypothetical protein
MWNSNGFGKDSKTKLTIVIGFLGFLNGFVKQLEIPIVRMQQDFQVVYIFNVLRNQYNQSWIYCY